MSVIILVHRVRDKRMSYTRPVGLVLLSELIFYLVCHPPQRGDTKHRRGR
ncbi:MAG: hypothetical protein HY664_04640 [Chloroflexi bacterium]|nr:hypothetical protein [Chloroflexota bacterium]